MSDSPPSEPDMTSQQLTYAFAPLHKRAFGMAIGLAAGLLVCGATLVYLYRGPELGPGLALLRHYFAGYTVSWAGAFVGLLWGFVAGFVAGWFFAFCRNLAMGILIFFIRVRSELAQTRDFLDHI
ncbi:MAG: hypothetical protein HKM89_15960 [Gemmatimonadales bacterium]|nr:hypothetical protein [Gemmatimonadales bacterium]